jgi:hypothetical protein
MSLKALQDHVICECRNYIKFHKVKDRNLPIRDMYETERLALRPLPAKRIETGRVTQAVVGHDLTFRYGTTKYSLPIEFVGKTITVQPRAYTVEAWYGGSLVFAHERPFAKGKHQYRPEHYLPLLERKPRAIRNAAPLKYGVLPPELETFRKRCTDKDKLEQLVNILLLGREVDAVQLLQAVDCTNKSGRPSYAKVCFYLKLRDEAFNPIELTQYDTVKVEYADLKQYDELIFNNGKGDDTNA